MKRNPVARAYADLPESEDFDELSLALLAELVVLELSPEDLDPESVADDPLDSLFDSPLSLCDPFSLFPLDPPLPALA